MGATPEGMGYHILLSVKMTLDVRINMFSAFLYHYMDSSIFLEAARRGGGAIALQPPKSATGYH